MLILPTMGNILIGLSFFKQYSVTLHIQNHQIHFPDLSLQLHKANGKNKCDKCELRAAQKIVVTLFQQGMLPACTNAEIEKTTGTTEATSTITMKEALLVTPVMVNLEKGFTIL